MAAEKKTNTLAQIGPIVAPLGGVLFAILFIAAALFTSSISEGTKQLTSDSGKITATMSNPAVITAPDEPMIPLPDAVVSTFARNGKNDWKADAGTFKLLEVPVRWEVDMEAPEGDDFVKADRSEDGSLDEPEFNTIEFPPDVPKSQRMFVNWDRNGDGLISRDEWDNAPIAEDERFAELDKNDDGVLTAPDEITSQEAFDWDSYPFEGQINLQEYIDRFKKKQERALGPVSNVAAKIDAATMEIVVTWQDPDITDKPEDISFMIRRRAPETIAKRQREYAKKVQEYTTKLSEWEARFDKWYNDPAKDANGKTNKQNWPKKQDAKKKFGETDPEPVAPPKVSDWEWVTDKPVTGNEYRDKNFDMDVTYTYAVFMCTQKNPKRGQKVREDAELAAMIPGWFPYADDTVAAGHPVLVRNRAEMGIAIGAVDGGLKISVTTWYKLEATGAWYRVEITESCTEGTQVGGNYRLADLKSRAVAMKDIAGTEVNALELLPSDVVIDLTTGYEFAAKEGQDALLESRELGDFVLPAATKRPATVTQGTAGSDNDLEVRCIAIKKDGKEATFEITRWVKVGDAWLRVIMISTAKSGADVGGEVSVEKPGQGVTVKDATGKTLNANDLKSFKDVKANLGAGKFGGLNERNLTIDGKEFDLFGTLYKG